MIKNTLLLSLLLLTFSQFSFADAYFPLDQEPSTINSFFSRPPTKSFERGGRKIHQWTFKTPKDIATVLGRQYTDLLDSDCIGNELRSAAHQARIAAGYRIIQITIQAITKNEKLDNVLINFGYADLLLNDPIEDWHSPWFACLPIIEKPKNPPTQK